MSLASCLNTLWMFKARPELRALTRSTYNVAGTQHNQLMQTLKANRDSQFGLRHGFDHIGCVRDFQSRVPLSRYEDYRESISQIAAGAPQVLTCETVRLLEPTGGTTGGEKLVPYTAGLLREFQRGIAAWIADLFEHFPAARAGRSYWSISPALGPARRTAGGVPIGFDDDAAYLGLLERHTLGRLLAVPPGVAKCAGVAAFRYRTLAYLLAAENLSLISIWNPSFLTQLLVPISQWIESIVRDLYDGRLRPPDDAGAWSQAADAAWRVNRHRARAIAAIWNTPLEVSERLGRLWPKLALISCWTDANSQLALPALRQLFPHVAIQGKGLLATEGFVSLPLAGLAAPALALRSHFFEFVESESRNIATARTCLAHEVRHGCRYRIVLTTSGGLYRYQLQDEVEILGFWNDCPLLRFVGKCDRTSDLVGEKLDQCHVQQALTTILFARGQEPRFAMLAPVVEQTPRYRLFVQAGNGPTIDRSQLARELNALLKSNPHYRYAIDLGQLELADVCILPPKVDACGIYERQCITRGQRLGNIKAAVFDLATDWPQQFGCEHVDLVAASSANKPSAT